MKTWSLWCLVLLLSCGDALGSTGPRAFYTDLESGPNVGGENDLGAFVTIYGAHFGQATAASRVAIGGGQAARLVTWSDTKVVVQLGRAASTGDIVVTTSAGVSNRLPFTVRPGNIYFVANHGNDANAGAFDTPWATVQTAVRRMAAGDITYIRDGIRERRAGSSAGSVSISRGGTPGAPMALIGYPNATAVIGDTSAALCRTVLCVEGIKIWSQAPTPQWWVIAGLHLYGNNYGLVAAGAITDPIEHIRIVGNEFYCPNGDGQVGCMEATLSRHLTVLGNHVRQAGSGGGPNQKYYHGFYFSSDTNHVEIGWNTIENVKGCRGILIHSTRTGVGHDSGYDQYDIRIHDNVIHDTACDGIALATVDPSRGPVEVYNNVIYRVGRESAAGVSGNFSCVSVLGYTNNGQPGTGMVDIYNNSTADCGGIRLYHSGAFVKGKNPNLHMRLTNNVLYQMPGEEYVFATEGHVFGGGNHFYGTGIRRDTPVGMFVSSTSPFFDVARGDLRFLQASQIPRNAFKPSAETDILGVVRSDSASIGAYEGVTANPDSPPSGLAVSPAVGEGREATVTLSVADADGVDNLLGVQVQLTQAFQQPDRCHVAYVPGAGLYLRRITSSGWDGPAAPGARVTLRNESCSVLAERTSVVRGTTSLAITLVIAFDLRLSGTNVIRGYAEDRDGKSTGWSDLGLWNVPVDDTRQAPFPSKAILLGPAGTNAQRIEMHFDDRNGGASIWNLHASLSPTVDQPNEFGCHVVLHTPTRSVYLRADDGVRWLGPQKLGSGSIENSQCRVLTSEMALEASGLSAKWTIPVSLQGSYDGRNHFVFGYAIDTSGLYSGWRLLGTWPTAAKSPGSTDLAGLGESLVGRLAGESATASKVQGEKPLWSVSFDERRSFRGRKPGAPLLSGLMRQRLRDGASAPGDLALAPLREFPLPQQRRTQ